MPSQEEHEKPENLVESPHQAEHEAHSLEDAVDSDGTLQGYYAMNNIKMPPAELEKELSEEEQRENRKRKMISNRL